jgi:hypothetical protein
MSYRDDLDALAARHDAIDVQVAEKTRERDRVAGMLADAKERARLPILPHIRVATPCRADWNEMVGDERVRHCATCDKDVFNLSSMTRDEAEALIVAKAGQLCARYYQRKDGTILLADCAVGLAQKRKRRVIAAGAAMLLAGGGGATWLAKHREPDATTGSVAFEESETVGTHVLAKELEPPPPPEPPHVEPQPEVAFQHTMGVMHINPAVLEQFKEDE